MARHPRQRVTFDPTLDSDLDDLLSDPVSPLSPINPLDRAIDLVGAQDLRRFDPTDAVPLDLVGRQATTGRDPVQLVGRTREFMENPDRMLKAVRQVAPNRFTDPALAVECHRRKERREVMFAQPERRRRKGSGGSRRRDEFSDIKC